MFTISEIDVHDSEIGVHDGEIAQAPDSADTPKSVHDAPKSVFTIRRNRCSRSAGIDVHDGPKFAGTLFLDEVGELPSQDQVKLLRALQERRIERIGGTEEIEVDVRIIAATNRVLLDEVENGNFRRDLYYRLAVMTFIISPLRDRSDDIPPLAHHFLALHCERMKMRVPHLTPEAEAALLRHHWPGNIRELENLIERTLALNGAEEIKAESLIFQTRRTKSKIQPVTSTEQPKPLDQGNSLIPPGVQFDDLSASEKRELIKRALQRSYGNREKAAALLGLSSRHQLYRLMVKLGVNPEVGD